MRRSAGRTLIALCVPSRRRKAARSIACSWRALISSRPVKPGCAAEDGRPVLRPRGQMVRVGDAQVLDHRVVPGAVVGRQVPACDQHAARAQHACDLGHRAVDVEPVEGLPRAGRRRRSPSAAAATRRCRRAPPPRAARAAGPRAGRRRARPRPASPQAPPSVRVSLPVPAAISAMSGRSGTPKCSNAIANGSSGQPAALPRSPRRLTRTSVRALRSHPPRRERVRVTQPVPSASGSSRTSPGSTTQCPTRSLTLEERLAARELVARPRTDPSQAAGRRYGRPGGDQREGRPPADTAS